jgi:hypothetical protein
MGSGGIEGCCGRALKYGKKDVFGGREALLFDSLSGEPNFSAVDIIAPPHSQDL